MKSFALIAIAAAVRLQAEEGPTAAQVFKECNTDGDNDLDYKEVTACFKKHKVSAKDQAKYGNALLKYAYIPKSNWAAVAAGVTKYTPATVTTADVASCDVNGNNKLSYKEVAACLKANAESLGLKTKKDWEAAKWGLAHAAVITQKGLKKAMNA